MTEPKRYEYDKQAAKALAGALTTLPDQYVACRDLRHAWLKVINDFHVVSSQSAKGGAKAAAIIYRDVQCIRCETIRHEQYSMTKYGLEKTHQTYEYVEGYQIPGVPRGVKPSTIIQQEQYRRAMERVAKAAKGERETAER